MLWIIENNNILIFELYKLIFLKYFIDSEGYMCLQTYANTNVYDYEAETRSQTQKMVIFYSAAIN